MNVLSYFKHITTFVFDIDGVLTDGTVLLFENGLQARQMHVKDDLALQMAMKEGFRVLVISGAYSEPVLQRLQYLGVQDIFLAIKDKRGFLEKYISENNLSVKEGYRILSAYILSECKVWIITEHDRSVTTILLPSEY